MQDLGGGQDDHASNDLEDSQRGSGQDAPSSLCPLEQELLELPRCAMKEQDAERLAGVLAQCSALAHLNLGCNGIGAAGAASLGGVLGQCAALAHLNLSGNQIGAEGAERLAGVLAQCPALAHLNLSFNGIGAAGTERLTGVLGQCSSLAHSPRSF